ncbi:MAG: hypothetical protein NTY90_05800 [Candidatus Micrarchaeota archaeon]|nr:hypothetical protein [Candidatus Micrarchaeota archaeon]
MLREIHRLSKQETAEARKWLRESKGRAYVLVHPYDASYLPFERIFQYSLLFHNKKSDKEPVFLFEEKKNMLELVRSIKLEESFQNSLPRRRPIRISVLGAAGGLKSRGGEKEVPGRPWTVRRRIILVPTEAGSPAPAGRSWKSVANRMRKLGAQKLRVCGRFLEKTDARELENRLEAMTDEKPAAAALLKEELRRSTQAAAYGIKGDERVLKRYEKKAAKSGSKRIEKKIERRQRQLVEKLRAVSGMCVGKAHRELALSGKFDDVRLLDSLSEMWKLAPGEKLAEPLRLIALGGSGMLTRVGAGGIGAIRSRLVEIGAIAPRTRLTFFPTLEEIARRTEARIFSTPEEIANRAEARRLRWERLVRLGKPQPREIFKVRPPVFAQTETQLGESLLPPSSGTKRFEIPPQEKKWRWRGENRMLPGKALEKQPGKPGAVEVRGHEKPYLRPKPRGAT